ncbi:hypothetical protein EON63_07990 [archaeon]|nr:MAG: hypothetical protein EON63_07990 [archaeon]
MCVGILLLRLIALYYCFLCCCWQIYNDDYCDLPDGSDETRTAACSHLNVRFQCLGMACKETSIPASRVNDGEVWAPRYK